MAPKVLLCDLVWASEDAKRLLSNNAEIVYMDSTSREDFLKGFEPNGKYDGCIAMYRTNPSSNIIGPFDREIITAISSSVKWVAHNGAGYDNVDVQALIDNGVQMSNTPGAVDEGTATIALYLMISAIRYLSLSERRLRELKWKPSISGKAHDLTGRTLAILGLGGIGLRFAEMTRGFPMRVIYHNRNKVADAPEWCEYFENIDEMLAQADVLSVHVPLNDNTVGLVGDKIFNALKPGAVIVNTARGKVIDEEALIRALESGHLGAAGLDVFPNEPEVNPRLMEFDNVTLVPHMGTETQDSQHSMEVRALQNIVDYLTKGVGRDLVHEMKK